MDGAVTKEEAAARWRLDLEKAEARSEQTWPRDIATTMSEFERLTLITEILMPVRNELALEFEETNRRDQPARQPSGDSHGDDDRTIDPEEDTGETGRQPGLLGHPGHRCGLQQVAQGGPGAGTEGLWAGLRDPDDRRPGDRHRPLGEGTGQAHDGRTGG